MNSNISPIETTLLKKDQIIIDTIYTPLKTKLVMDAESAGARTMTGLDMFIYQALASTDLWFGEGATNKVNFEELKGHIGSYLC
jgi:shikimate 5-dehydrogenase